MIEKFQGSILQVEMSHTNYPEAFSKLTKAAVASEPESEFWQDAWDYIQKQCKKTRRKQDEN